VGRRVRTLFAGVLPAGRHEVEWDGRGKDGERVASGVYVAVIRAGNREAARTLLFLR
jgi:flagellar hook assembly protein FlgD